MIGEPFLDEFLKLHSCKDGVHDKHINSDHSDDSPTTSPFFIDFEHIESICSTNWFGFPTGIRPLKASFGPHEPSEASNNERGTGLYLLASYINHSCIPNAHRQFFNEVMVTRATQSIKAGEEITISYCRYASYEERDKALKKWFDSCDCQLCVEDRLAGPDRRALRYSLAEKIAKATTSHSKSREAIKKMSTTYIPQAGRLRPELSGVYHILSHRLQEMASDFRDKNAANEAIEKEIQALEFLGVDVVEKGVSKINPSFDEQKLPISTRFVASGFGQPGMYCLMIFAMLVILGRPERATQWVRAALWSECIIHSTNVCLNIFQCPIR